MGMIGRLHALANKGVDIDIGLTSAPVAAPTAVTVKRLLRKDLARQAPARALCVQSSSRLM